jgi:hypothetical protein
MLLENCRANYDFNSDIFVKSQINGSVGGNVYIGGLIGIANGKVRDAINNCYFEGNLKVLFDNDKKKVNTYLNIGGLVGFDATASIYNSTAKCEIATDLKSSGIRIGGLAGQFSAKKDFKNNVFVGNVEPLTQDQQNSLGSKTAHFGAVIGYVNDTGSASNTTFTDIQYVSGNSAFDARIISTLNNIGSVVSKDAIANITPATAILTPVHGTLSTSDPLGLKVMIYPEDSSGANITGIWEAVNPDVVTLTPNGLTASVKGAAVGQTMVKFTVDGATKLYGDFAPVLQSSVNVALVPSSNAKIVRIYTKVENDNIEYIADGDGLIVIDEADSAALGNLPIWVKKDDQTALVEVKGPQDNLFEPFMDGTRFDFTGNKIWTFKATAEDGVATDEREVYAKVKTFNAKIVQIYTEIDNFKNTADGDGLIVIDEADSAALVNLPIWAKTDDSTASVQFKGPRDNQFAPFIDGTSLDFTGGKIWTFRAVADDGVTTNDEHNVYAMVKKTVIKEDTFVPPTPQKWESSVVPNPDGTTVQLIVKIPIDASLIEKLADSDGNFIPPYALDVTTTDSIKRENVRLQIVRSDGYIVRDYSIASADDPFAGPSYMPQTSVIKTGSAALKTTALQTAAAENGGQPYTYTLVISAVCDSANYDAVGIKSLTWYPTEDYHDSYVQYFSDNKDESIIYISDTTIVPPPTIVEETHDEEEVPGGVGGGGCDTGAAAIIVLAGALAAKAKNSAAREKK